MTSIFEVKHEEKKTLSIKIDHEIKKSIDEIQNRLKENNPEMTFPVGLIVEDALKKAIKKANSELDIMKETTV